MDKIDSSRAMLHLTGDDVQHFLQGLLTQDVTKLGEQKIQFAALLSPQGKILHDMFVLDAATVGAGDGVLLDTAAAYKETLLKRLALYKLRAKVNISDASATWHVSYSLTHGLTDPRHAQLPHRFYAQELSAPNAVTVKEYHTQRLVLGIPDSSIDFAPDEIVALDAGYDLLHAVSFTKGCYVGQEITARMHYKKIARKGFYLLSHPGHPPRLILLKFDEVSSDSVIRDGVCYQAVLPEWMAPKLAQYLDSDGAS